MDDQPGEDIVVAKLKPEFPTKHREWREVLRDVHAVRGGLDRTSSGDSSAYEALERLQQDVRSEMNSRIAAESHAKALWSYRNEELLRMNLRLKDENVRLREELDNLRP
jgi:hypothetical protein